MKRVTFPSLFYFFFILILIFQLVSQIKSGYAKESYGITEWLINYQGGFVRRGLLGELLYNLNSVSCLNIYSLILSICLILYLVLVIFFVRSFKKKKFPTYILPFVFFLGSPILNNFWVRKDVLLILIFILVIFFSLKETKWSIVFVNIFLVLGILIHESIGFFTLPFLALLLFRKLKNSKNSSNLKTFFVLILQLLPSIFAFCLCLMNKGSWYISNQIWNSWKPIQFPIQSIDNSTVPTAIAGLSWSLKTGLTFAIKTLKNFNDGIYAPIAWFLILVLIYYILINSNWLNVNFKSVVRNGLNRIHLSRVLIFQFVSICPLFILGWDYGRWIFYWVSTSFAIIILLPHEMLQTLFPNSITLISKKITDTFDSTLGNSNRQTYIMILLLGVPTFSWELSYFLHSSPLVIVLRFISDKIQEIYTMISWHPLN